MHEGIARFRALGGKRAILTNVHVELGGPASPENPDDPFDLVGPKSVAQERLRRIADLGYDDLVILERRHAHDGALALSPGPGGQNGPVRQDA